jgi:isoleucyl-tRNA synthetase
LSPLGEELRFVLITSEASVAPAAARPEDALAADGVGKAGLWLRVTPVGHAKCVRCWHKRPDVGTVAAHPELCGRCVDNLEGAGETRRYA